MPKITLNLDTLTLGELSEAERQSGVDAQKLLQGSMSRMILAVFISDWRTSGHVPSWSAAADRRLLDVLSSTSVSPQDAPSPTSKA